MRYRRAVARWTRWRAYDWSDRQAGMKKLSRLAATPIPMYTIVPLKIAPDIARLREKTRGAHSSDGAHGPEKFVPPVAVGAHT